MERSLIALHADTMMRLWDEAELGVAPSAGGAGFEVGDAYEIAGEVLRRREGESWRRAGRKIGFTNREMMIRYGVGSPIFGYLYDRTLSEARQGAAALSLGRLVQPLIEPEIVFKLRRAPPATSDPRALLESVEWLAQGFELVQCHFPDWILGAADAIADGGLHGRYVVGEPTAVEAGTAASLARQLESFAIELVRDGETVAEGGGERALGSPLNALAHLVTVLQELPGHPPLQAGELVTTGTLTTALPVTAGQVWSTRITGLPVAPVRLCLD
jgi:2-keto-4-pentenoate hydratase